MSNGRELAAILLHWSTFQFVRRSMIFSILHLSDLHRDLNDEVNNDWLLESLANDINQLTSQNPNIAVPSVCIVSGDLAYGVGGGHPNAEGELQRQYLQAEEFLIGLADRFFTGKREQVVILPGNHDVAYPDVLKSMEKLGVPADAESRKRLVADFFRPNSTLRWSWQDLCFYRIVDAATYENRFRHFSTMYERFYSLRRHFPSTPERQYELFDFPELRLCVLALNSCFRNDPFRRAGAFNPTALANACKELRHTNRAGWLLAAAWHHNITGGPTSEDYLDTQFIQLLVDAGASLGFHGHQHFPECFDERYRIGPNPRKMTVISASTLCAEPSNLAPGIPRSYNIIEFNTETWKGRVHQRQMVNSLFPLPVWGPGHFPSNGLSYFDFDLCPPAVDRPPLLDLQLSLERAERLVGEGKWDDALETLTKIREIEIARPLLLKTLIELGDERNIILNLWPPQTVAETVTLGGAIFAAGTNEEISRFLELPAVRNCTDASIREISSRIRERRLR